mgnify:CR=1 FL=1
MKKALLIGIDDYSWAPLKGCESDAKNLNKVLSTNYDGSKNFDTKVLLSSTLKITRNELRRQIEDLFKYENDVALLYFSGHSSTVSIDTFLVTQDATTGDQGIPFSEIVMHANSSPVKEVVILLDCFDSGSIGNFSFLKRDSAILRKGITILTSSEINQSAFEQQGQGVFTSFLVKALEGRAADQFGRVTILDIFNYIDKLLGAWDQRPVFKAHIKQALSLRQCSPKSVSNRAHAQIEIKREIDRLISKLESLNIGEIEPVKTEFKESINNLMKKQIPSRVFISYSHKDEEWLDRIYVHLTPLVREDLIDVWSDKKIRSGSNWRSEIMESIAFSKVAILLITADFLASDFIARKELPQMLESADQGQLTIVPVILKPSRFEKDKNLSGYQAANDPSRPLISLTEGEQEQVLVKLSMQVEDILYNAQN